MLISNYGRYRLKRVCELESVGILKYTEQAYRRQGSAVSRIPRSITLYMCLYIDTMQVTYIRPSGN